MPIPSSSVFGLGGVCQRSDCSKVKWETEPRILGQQQSGAKALNFCGQRFSWFEVYPVESAGSLKVTSDFSKVDIDTVIATMEAVLIEGLEPRQNRKRGDAEFQAIEFLQVEDPKLERNRKLAVMQELAAQLKNE
jgi:hypothetical protein